jgi:peptidylprolyl isomerase/peptidyl-prolyl cis-trans isomerase B (cyclophilin B)
VVLILVTAVGAAGAQSAAPGREVLRQDGQTPAELCDQATADLAEPESRVFGQAEDVLEAGTDYWAVLCTAQGPIYLDLFEDRAPQTVNNFVFLAENDYYNNTTFHRVLPGFMAQGGDPTGTGSGGPGYSFGDETDNELVFDTPGLLAMANAGPNTNGSQFFITYAPTPWLDGNHTIFGEVYQGLDVAELLTPRDPEQVPGYEGDALQTVVIVQDPAGVNATEDAAPSGEHFQALLEQVIAGQLNQQFQIVEARSGLRDLDAEAEAWADGGEELVDLMRETLSANDFQGAATIWLETAECPANPEDLPIWGIGLSVVEFGSAEQAEAVVNDEARAGQIVESGLFATSETPEEVSGRVYGQPTDAYCSPDGMFYRYEVPRGRYMLVAEMAVDGTIINDEAEPSVVPLLDFLMTGLLEGSIGSTLDRGNEAAASE